MSKGSSALFKHTTGANADLLQRLMDNGIKCTPENIVGITVAPNSGTITWMESGSSRAWLNHIISEHGHELNEMGLSNYEIPNYVMEAISQGSIVGYQKLVILFRDQFTNSPTKE